MQRYTLAVYFQEPEQASPTDEVRREAVKQHGAIVNPWFILAYLAVGTFAVFQGYQIGYSSASRKLEAEITEAQNKAFRNAELASKKEEQRLLLQEERDNLAMSLENDANNDPDSSRVCIGTDGVRRLNLR